MQPNDIGPRGSLQRLLEQSADLAALVDHAGRWLFTNREWRRRLGWDHDTKANSGTLWDSLAPATARMWQQQMNSDNGTPLGVSVQGELQRADGCSVPVRGNLVPWGSTEGTVAPHWMVLLQPRSNGRTAPEDHNEPDPQWGQGAAFFAANLDLLCIATTDGHFVRVNPAWSEVLGLPSQQLEGVSFLNFVHPEDRSATESALEQLGRGQSVVNFVNRYRAADGQYLYLEWSSRPEGQLVYAAARDVTERVRLDKKLREQTDQFQLAIQGSNDGIWDWNVLTNDLYLSPKWKQQLGYDDEELPNSFETFVRLLHPEDKGTVLEKADQFIDGTITVFDTEFRLLCKDGTYRWIRARGAAQRDTEGRAQRIAGSHTDVTESRQAQAALAESEAKFRAITESALDAIILMDSGGHIRYWSPAAEAVFGYSDHEVMGCDVHDLLMPERYRRRFRRGFDTYLQTGTGAALNQVMEMTALHASGRELPVEIALAPVCVGGEKWASAVVRDISSRQETEQTLSHWRDLMRYIIEHNRSAVAVHDRDLRYLYVSKSYLESHRVQEADVIGRHHYDVFPDLPQKWRDVHQRALQGEVLSAEEDPYPRHDGTTEWTRWECRPWYEKDGSIGGIIVYTEVITERKQMEEAIAHEREQFRTTLFPLFDAVVTIDTAGRVAIMNHSAETLTGWTQQAAFGRAVDEVLRIDDERSGPLPQHPAVTALHTGRSTELPDSVQLTNEQNRTLPVEGSAAPITDKQGVVTGAVIVFRDVTDKRERQAQVQYLSIHDHLTGLFNRRYMEDVVRRLDSEGHLPLAVVVADVNGLKLTNDAFGHEMGDALLVKVAAILREACRPSDIICRVGGDEFVILLPRTNEAAVDQLTKKIKARTRRAAVGSVIVSLAVGSAVKTTMDQSLFEIQREADNTMYRNKLRVGRIMRSQTIETVLRNINSKYDSEQIHTERVSQYCEHVARALNFSSEAVEDAKVAAVLHDIGKIMVPADILNKVGRLTDEEWRDIQRHPLIGYQILKGVDEYAHLATAVLDHHERWDGRGYPEGLKGTDIPLLARVIAVADAFEAMTAQRSYQRSRTKHEAIAELQRCAGTQFDPEVVKVFVGQVLAAEI